MKNVVRSLSLLLAAVFFLGGCATRPAGKSSAVNPPIPPSPGHPGAPGKSEAAPTSDVPAAPATQGLFLLKVDSEPAGALVLVNGTPFGHAPLRVPVTLTGQGFFRDYVSIKVRFVGNSPGEFSGTVEENFTPREKMPARVVFTPTGAIRKTN